MASESAESTSKNSSEASAVSTGSKNSGNESSAKVQSESNTPGFIEPDFTDELRKQMLKFALMQLNDLHLAEDAVQDALIGAMNNSRSFAGRSAYKTWVFAILKNKIVDIIRKRQRQIDITSLAGNSEEDEDFSELFDKKGHWHSDDTPISWADPVQNYKESQFWVVFETCLDGLPPKQAKTFMMREFIGLETDEICREMELSVSNLHVVLYRARMRLQKCLEIRWYGAGQSGEGEINREKL